MRVVLIVGAALCAAVIAAPSAAQADMICVQLETVRVCRTPLPSGRTRVCNTARTEEGISIERCRVESPKPPERHSRSFFLSRAEAEGRIRQHVRGEGYEDVIVGCWLPPGEHAKPGYIYHRWRCVSEGDSTYAANTCRIEAYVTGSNNPRYFGYAPFDASEACVLGR